MAGRLGCTGALGTCTVVPLASALLTGSESGSGLFGGTGLRWSVLNCANPRKCEHPVKCDFGPLGVLGIHRDLVGSSASGDLFQCPIEVGEIDAVHRGAETYGPV